MHSEASGQPSSGICFNIFFFSVFQFVMLPTGFQTEEWLQHVEDKQTAVPY
jgi:hypothetical protein